MAAGPEATGWLNIHHFHANHGAVSSYLIYVSSCKWNKKKISFKHLILEESFRTQSRALLGPTQVLCINPQASQKCQKCFCAIRRERWPVPSVHWPPEAMQTLLGQGKPMPTKLGQRRGLWRWWVGWRDTFSGRTYAGSYPHFQAVQGSSGLLGCNPYSLIGLCCHFILNKEKQFPLP